MKTFEDLEAWKEAKSLAVAVYRLTQEKPLSSDFSLRDQIQRSAVSIMSNIAEGFERLHKLEKKQFYNIARASCGELRSQLHFYKNPFRTHGSVESDWQTYQRPPSFP